MKNQNLLLELLRVKDKKRLKVLYATYGNNDIMCANASIKYICDYLNKELGEELVSVEDIKYCRKQFLKKVEKRRTKLPELPKIIVQKPIKTENMEEFIEIKNGEISWTNPADLEEIKNKNISKFINQNGTK